MLTNFLYQAIHFANILYQAHYNSQGRSVHRESGTAEIYHVTANDLIGKLTAARGYRKHLIFRCSPSVQPEKTRH